MRRLAVISAALLVLGAPAAWALTAGPNDGTLVVRDGTAPKGVPVVTLVITGAAIGHISNLGTIVIDDQTPTDPYAPEVSNADWHKDVSDTATKWSGTNMKFRAVGGTYKITIYGSDVDLSAVGRGVVTLAGMPDLTSGDGTYSLNGDPFRSLPATPLAKLAIGAVSNG